MTSIRIRSEPEALGADPAVHGIILQTPLPPSADFDTLASATDPEKDVNVGTNVDADGNLIGDVDCAPVDGTAAALTPVPGGVGPVTTAVLLWHTITSATP